MANHWKAIAESVAVGAFTINSGDTHVVEPRDLWVTRLDKEFLDRAPRVERVGDRDFWFCEGRNLTHCGHRATRWQPEQYTGRYDDQRPGGMNPEACLMDSDLDGIDVNVLFPSPTLFFYGISDPILASVVLRAYNDWLADFCSHDPRRLKGVAVLLLPEDIAGAVRELERCVEMGFVGGLIPMLSPPERTYDDPVYDPLWMSAEDMGVPLVIHTGAVRSLQGASSGSKSLGSRSLISLFGMASYDALARDNLTAMIYGGVFERHPSLLLGCLEMGTGWIPSYMRRLDRAYLVRRGDGSEPKRFASDRVPSDFIRRNMFFGFEDEDLGVKFREIIGVDNLVYANDYPHPDCVWPRSRQVLQYIFKDSECKEEERAKLAGGNAVRLWKLDTFAGRQA